MEKPIYTITASDDGLYYSFKSKNDNRVINKFVAYIPDEFLPERYHLLFGDMPDDKTFDVFAVSNNNDMVLVLSTVIKTLLEFFVKNPDKTVFFTGSTLSRTRLYRVIIGKLMNNVELYYEISGMLDDGTFEKFNSVKTYKAFLIAKKS